jgi:hypothetical protein
MHRIIKLIPCNTPLQLQTRSIEQKLRNLALETSKRRPTRQTHSAVVPHLNGSNPLNGRRTLVPRIRVLVDLGGQPRDVELVRVGAGTPELPGGAAGRVRVDDEAEATGGGVVVGDVPGGFGPDLLGG